MICDKCGQTFSDKVMEIHYPVCKASIKQDLIEQTELDVRAKAKFLGIKSWHTKSIERLESEIEELEK